MGLLPSSVLNGNSLFSLIYGREQNLSHLRSFWCLCFATVIKGSDEFFQQSKKCVLFSVDESVKEHTKVSTLNFFDHFESEPVSKTPSCPNDDEEASPGRDGRVHQPVNGSIIKKPGNDGDHPATHLDEQNNYKVNVGINQEVLVFQNDLPNEIEEVGPRRSQRPSKLPARLNEFVMDDKVKYGLNRYANHSFLSAKNYCFVSNQNKCIEPSSYEEVVKDVNRVNAMNEEMNALYENKTWSMTNLPFDGTPIGSKWVFKIKYKSNGEIEIYKARLVAKGFGQKEGIDYAETFSPVVKISFFSNNESKVCKLKKNLYGLKQAPRQWNHNFSEALLEACVIQSKNDHSLFIKSKEGVSMYLLVYVDDLVITGSNVDEIENFKKFLNNKFKIKDLVLFRIASRVWLICRPVMTYLPENIMLSCKESEVDKFLSNITNYQKLVGKLIYLTHTRPDISYSVHCLSRHMHAPLKSHFDIAMRVLKYLKLAPGLGVNFSKRKNDYLVTAFFTYDWAKCLVTRRSVLGFYVYINGNHVSWKSKRQATLSESFTEAEYRCMASITCEIMWIIMILSDFGMDNLIPANLYYDNKFLIHITANPVMHEKTNHFDIDVHLVRAKVSFCLIKTVKDDSKGNVAGILTKALRSFQHGLLTKKLGLDIFDYLHEFIVMMSCATSQNGHECLPTLSGWIEVHAAQYVNSQDRHKPHVDQSCPCKKYEIEGAFMVFQLSNPTFDYSKYLSLHYVSDVIGKAIYKVCRKGKDRSAAQGKCRYDRNQSEYGRQTKPVFRNK
ncbi:putative RNA-directed DNA polymerase, partial [Tanacetum coccineum]